MTKSEGIIAADAPAPASALAYRPEIDGLRAVAVLAVVLYHAGIAPVAGGFVGVDVFFVISGYLIMAALAGDIRAGRFSVLAFYERRIRRIFPALFVMALFCLVAGAAMLPPDAYAGFGQSLLAMALFASNLLFCFDSQAAGGYFATAAATQLLLHTWSLAVEEQFYILLPLGLVILRRFRARRTLPALVLVAGLSFAFSVWAVAAWPLGAFYLVPFRAWELLLGSVLALGAVPAIAGRWPRELVAALGLGLILYAVFAFSQRTAFPGAAALVPCLGAGLLIHAGAAGPTLTGRALASRLPVGIGRISYSLYLWHWPLIVLVRYLNTGKLNATSTALILVASLAAGYGSYRCVERPFRGRSGFLTRGQLFAGGTLATLAALAAAFLIIVSHGLPQRFDPQTLRLVAANMDREHDHPAGDCANWQTDIHALSDIHFCAIGHGEPRNILFWGDSLMDSLRPVVKTLYDEGALTGRGAVFAAAAGCTPAPGLSQSSPGYHCSAFSSLALERAGAADIDTVFIAFWSWWDTVDGGLCIADADDRCARPLPRGEAEDVFMQTMSAYVRTLRRQGKHVILSLPAPSYDLLIPQMQINDVILRRTYGGLRRIGLVRRPRRNDYLSLRTRITALAAATGATLYDPLHSLCAGGSCAYQRGGISLYSDNIHFAASQIGVFHDELEAALRGR